MAAPDFAAPNISTEAIAPARVDELALATSRPLSAVHRVETILDFATGAAAILTCWLFLLKGPSIHRELSWREIAGTAISCGLVLAFLGHRERTHRPDSGLLRIRETERCLRTSIQSVVVLFILSVIWNLNLPGLLFIVALQLTPSLLIAQKHVFLGILHRWLQDEHRLERTVVCGMGKAEKRVISTMLQSPRLGIHIVDVIDDSPGQQSGRLNVMGYRGRGSIDVQPWSLSAALLKSRRANLLLLSVARLAPEQIKAAIAAAEEAGAKIGFIDDSATELGKRMERRDVDGVQISQPTELPSVWLYAPLKRVLDVAVSAVFLILFAPLFLLIAALIRFDSPGPALFVQKRVGKDGVLFDMYKFRSMYTSAAGYEPSPSSSHDIRITLLGRFLRRTSLDELPQLLNVLLGDMSLVGPRPEMPFIVNGYDQVQRQRLVVTPGITGLWQLSADRAFPIHHNLEYDLYYIRNRNPFMDFAILIHTLFFALSGGI